MIGPISHDLQQLRKGLSRLSPASIDTETTGLERRDRVLSVGIRFGGTNYILFTSDCTSNSIVPYISTDEQIQTALEPVEGLTQVYHSVQFDLPRLRRFGVRFSDQTIDTLQLHRLRKIKTGGSRQSQAPAGVVTDRTRRPARKLPVEGRLQPAMRHQGHSTPRRCPCRSCRSRHTAVTWRMTFFP